MQINKKRRLVGENFRRTRRLTFLIDELRKDWRARSDLNVRLPP